MRMIIKYKDRRGSPYLVNREALSEVACTRIAEDTKLSPLQVAVNLALGQRLIGGEGRSYRLENR